MIESIAIRTTLLPEGRSALGFGPLHERESFRFGLVFFLSLSLLNLSLACANVIAPGAIAILLGNGLRRHWHRSANYGNVAIPIAVVVAVATVMTDMTEISIIVPIMIAMFLGLSGWQIAVLPSILLAFVPSSGTAIVTVMIVVMMYS